MYTHKNLMAQVPAKFSLQKIKDVWGAKSPEEERLIALLAKLKGKLKLTPKLAKKKHDDKKDGQNKKTRGNKKRPRTRRILPTRNSRSRKRHGGRYLPRITSPRRSLSVTRLTIDESTTWPGECTPPRNAA
jgi:hypothetical protein